MYGITSRWPSLSSSRTRGSPTRLRRDASSCPAVGASRAVRWTSSISAHACRTCTCEARRMSQLRGWRKPMVLDGVVVLDITQAGAGAFATRLLADLGALVLKIELPPAGDLSRIMFATQTGDGILFENNNAGKRGLCFDYRQPAGKELLVELLAKSDVFIENFSAGTVARYGLDYPTIVGIRTDVVMCSVSTFRQTGPCRHHVGAEPSAQALASMAYMNREPGERPILVSSAIPDSATAVHAALAVVAALYRRALTA